MIKEKYFKDDCKEKVEGQMNYCQELYIIVITHMKWHFYYFSQNRVMWVIS